MLLFDFFDSLRYEVKLFLSDFHGRISFANAVENEIAHHRALIERLVVLVLVRVCWASLSFLSTSCPTSVLQKRNRFLQLVLLRGKSVNQFTEFMQKNV